MEGRRTHTEAKDPERSSKGKGIQVPARRTARLSRVNQKLPTTNRPKVSFERRLSDRFEPRRNSLSSEDDKVYDRGRPINPGLTDVVAPYYPEPEFGTHYRNGASSALRQHPRYYSHQFQAPAAVATTKEDPESERNRHNINQILQRVAAEDQRRREETIQETTLKVAVESTAEAMRVAHHKAQKDIESASIKADIMAREKAEKTERERKAYEERIRRQVEQEVAVKNAEKEALREQITAEVQESERKKAEEAARNAAYWHRMTQAAAAEAVNYFYQSRSSPSHDSEYHSRGRGPGPFGVAQSISELELDADVSFNHETSAQRQKYAYQAPEYSSGGDVSDEISVNVFQSFPRRRRHPVPPPVPSAPSPPRSHDPRWTFSSPEHDNVRSRAASASGFAPKEEKSVLSSHLRGQRAEVSEQHSRAGPCLDADFNEVRNGSKAYAVSEDEDDEETYTSARTSPAPQEDLNHCDETHCLNRESSALPEKTKLEDLGSLGNGMDVSDSGNERPQHCGDGEGQQRQDQTNVGKTPLFSTPGEELRLPRPDPGISETSFFTRQASIPLPQSQQVSSDRQAADTVQRRHTSAGTQIPEDEEGYRKSYSQYLASQDQPLSAMPFFPYGAYQLHAPHHQYAPGGEPFEAFQNPRSDHAPIPMMPMMVFAMAPIQYQYPPVLPGTPIYRGGPGQSPGSRSHGQFPPGS
ncbi:hypothetical protein GQ607_017131 [Colletotrichum asianum]|uniref:Uncharacterized protein n=1 Tax=Colletotrichum asianum TaxID=702518 RepID=A0A8H3VWX7_9PEZI|nr:hypothetical protein GQ607_017131 [Colletotrichum asianum]